MKTGAVHGVDKLAVIKPQMVDIKELGPGEIGIFTGSIKKVRDTRCPPATAATGSTSIGPHLSHLSCREQRADNQLPTVF
ncbi:MAG: hypothetical protein WBN04_14130 [Paracoccaceae bacterium]